MDNNYKPTLPGLTPKTERVLNAWADRCARQGKFIPLHEWMSYTLGGEELRALFDLYRITDHHSGKG